MTTLLAIAGFAVDVGNWYFHIQRMQRGADAAALAGSVFLPGDYTSANGVANTSLTQNNLNNDQIAITQLPAHPTQLRVDVTEPVKSIFLRVIGLNQFTFTRSAVAEYRPYVPMGSPSNVLGQEPNPSDVWEKSQDIGLQDHYWLNISAAGTAKGNGDRYSGGLCDSATDGCNTGVTAPYGNIDYNPLGQAFIVRIKPGTTGTLSLQAFDPEFAYVGDNCTAAPILTSNTLFNPSNNTGMYTYGNDNPYCTGDNMTDATKLAPSTTFSLWTPDTTAGGSTQISSGSCTPKTYPGYKSNIMQMLTTGNAAYDANFANTYRKWATFCQLTIGSAYPAGDYILRVNNSTSTAYNGLNRYALRAAFMNGASVNTTKTQNISLFSQGRLVVYAHDTTGDVTFFIAQVHSGSAGENLNVTLFDIGDATGGASLSFLPPSDAKSKGKTLSSFNNCAYTPPQSSVYQPTASNCSILGMNSSQYNARVVNIRVALPADYTCDDTSGDGCWTRLQLHYGAGTVNDTTSWQVTLDGNPVHLLPNAT